MYLRLVSDEAVYRVTEWAGQPKLTKKKALEAAHDALDELTFVNYVLVYNDKHELVERLARP